MYYHDVQRPQLKSPSLLHVLGSPRPFWVSPAHRARLSKYDWRWVPRIKRARALVKSKAPRVLLHRFIVHQLLEKDWAEIFFLNGNECDCRAGNLAPYRREQEGACRRFKKKSALPRGVYLKQAPVGPKRSRHWGAAIKVKRKLHHLGYFLTVSAAAAAYAAAWRQAHPGLKFVS